MDVGEAFAMITSRPAETLGMGRDFGSLAPGRRADVVIWSDDPLQVSSSAEAVFCPLRIALLSLHQCGSFAVTCARSTEAIKNA